MSEREKPQKKSPDHGISRVINNLVPEGKAFGYLLAGPRRGEAIFDNFLTVIFSREDECVLLRPVVARGSKVVDIYKKILNLGVPDDFNEIEIPVKDDVKKSVRLECVTKNTPLAVLALGKTTTSKSDLAILYVVAGVPPKEVHDAICEGANKVINYLKDNNEQPPIICN